MLPRSSTPAHPRLCCDALARPNVHSATDWPPAARRAAPGCRRGAGAHGGASAGRAPAGHVRVMNARSSGRQGERAASDNPTAPGGPLRCNMCTKFLLSRDLDRASCLQRFASLRSWSCLFNAARFFVAAVSRGRSFARVRLGASVTQIVSTAIWSDASSCRTHACLGCRLGDPQQRPNLSESATSCRARAARLAHILQHGVER